MRRTATFLLFLASCGRNDGSAQVPAYLIGDGCHDHGDQKTCTADATCEWRDLELPCASGTACPSGVCQAVDACRSHGDQTSCSADTACDWVPSAGLCPAGYPCPSPGICTHRPDQGCACACPLICPEGMDCPPCSCDCPPPPSGTGGGGTCGCACPACPAGTPCPACACDCQPPPPTCGGGNTCTCSCPLACVEGGPCPPPCDCDCAGGGGTTPPPSCTTVCPSCNAGEACPPCEAHCDVPGGQPTPGAPSSSGADTCGDHKDQASCLADTGQHCGWAAVECLVAPCPDGVCYAQPTDPCICNCPECPAGAACAPCACDCPPPVVCPGPPTPQPQPAMPGPG